MSGQQITPLSELGEFGLIDHLSQQIKLIDPGTIKGIGDDAAVLDYVEKQIVVTTDLLMEGIHFDLIYTPLRHLGYKAVVVNLSDVYAMNAKPRHITVSLAISAKFSVEAVDELYSGILLACEKYGVDLVGGDTSASLTGMTISVTALGEVEKENVVYRNTAGVNDLICVSGNLGAAYMGLQLLEREKKIFLENKELQPDFSGRDYILERQLKPEARKDIIALFKENNIKPTSMIDISDGLSSEIIHICKKSQVGCKIFHEKIPVDTETALMAEEFNMDPITCALNGGEDYELLFTMALTDYDKIKEFKDVSIIGHITHQDEGINLVSSEGVEIPIVAQGWNAMPEPESK
jgi:thiamine-monophosphate kinase